MRFRIVHGGEFKWATYRKRRQAARQSKAPSAALYRWSLVPATPATRSTSNGLTAYRTHRFRLRATLPQLFAVACARISHAGNAQERLGPRARHRAIATYAFGIALLLATGQSEGGTLSAASRLPLLGALSGISVLSTRTVSYVPAPKQVAFVTLTAILVACAAIFVLPFCLRRPPLQHPLCLRCGVLPYEASFGAPSSRPLYNRFKAPSRKKIETFNKRAAGAMLLLGAASTVPIALFVSSDASFMGDSIQVAAMINAWAPRVRAFCGHRRNRLDAEPRAQPVRFPKGAFRNCAAQFLSHFPWQRIQYVARSDFSAWFGWCRSPGSHCSYRAKLTGVCGMRPIRPGRNVSFLCAECLLDSSPLPSSRFHSPICRNRWSKQRWHHAHLQHKHGLRNAALPGNQYAYHQRHAS